MKPTTPPVLLVATIIVLGTTSSYGQERATVDEKDYARMPWHLVDVWWDLGKDVPFQSYSIDVTISEDVPSSTNLYIAPIGLGHLGKTPFYGGIQTQADGHTKKDRHVRKLGPGFLFSMWGERGLDAIRPSLGGFCQSSGHEGDFVSVRRPYEWHKGTYTFRIVRMDEEEPSCRCDHRNAQCTGWRNQGTIERSDFDGKTAQSLDDKPCAESENPFT